MTLLQVGSGGTATTPSGPVPNSSVATYATLIATSAKQYNLDPNFLAAILTQESGGNATAVSGAGTLGIAQFMPGTGASYGLSGSQFFSPGAEIPAAAHYLSDLLNHFGGNYNEAAAAYNAGQGTVDAYGLSTRLPSETQAYWPSVAALRNAWTSSGIFGATNGTIATTPPAAQGYTQPSGTGNQASLTSLPGDLGGALSSADQNLKNYLAGLAGQAVSPATSAVTTGLSGLANLAQDWGKQVGKWLLLAIIGIVFLLVLDQLVTGRAPQPVPV